MKNKLSLVILLLCFSFSGKIFSQDISSVNASELDIYNEINIYSNAGYYPGVVEQVELLEENFPGSVFIVPSRIAKAQALTTMNRYEEAEETLYQVLSSIHFGSPDYAKCWYQLGKAYYYDGNYTQSLSAFHTVCDVELREEKIEYYHSAILYAGRINYFMELYEKCIPLFEYVISNGTEYDAAEYDEALQKLMFAYNDCQQYKKTISLYYKFTPEAVSEKVYSALTIYAADAYEKSDDVQKAYEVLNSNHNEDFAEMLSDFRINLGIAAYNKKNYDSASEYFELAKDTQNNENHLTIFIYEQKIKLDKNGATCVSEVQEALLQKQQQLLESQTSKMADSFYALLMRCYAFTAKNESQTTQVINIYEKIAVPGPKDAYVAAGIVQSSDKKKAESILEPFAENTECAKLYAAILAQNGKLEQSQKLYEKLETQNQLDELQLLEYSKVLYRQKKWAQAKSKALASKQPLASYIAGLCDFNTGAYDSAYSYFRQYNSQKQTEPNFKKISTFYWAYCSYKKASYKEAFTTLDSYIKNYKQKDEYLYKAYELAAKSALMINDLRSAYSMAQGMIDNSATLEQKQDAIIYCAEIYSDAQEYEKAADLLNSYTRVKSDFAVRCLLQIAKIYEKIDRLDDADSIYSKIVKEYEGTDYAESAAYRSGEVFYSQARYDEAETRFSKYIYSFINGKYSDAAYYFSGDCNMKNNELDKAIMQNTTLVSKYPDSVYCYGAYKNLLEAYYTQENYTDALVTARILVRNYSEQAVSDGIGQKIIELEQIVSGTDKNIVEKYGEYDRNGKTSTKKGRDAGSQLVQLYAQAGEDESAFALATELLQYQKNGNEMYNAALNADFIAGYYQKQGKNQDAALMYLKVAEYFRASGQDSDDKAAGALYSATDNFMACGLRGDAEETAKLLVSLYPETKQGKKVMNLIK